MNVEKLEAWPKTPRRILITGTREDGVFPPSVVRRVISGFLGEDWVTLVHGGCPTGIDAIAESYRGLYIQVEVESHPADWSRGKKAGPLRNQKMVDLGAEICLAFPGPDSRGTHDCKLRAYTAGIPVVVIDYNERR